MRPILSRWRARRAAFTIVELSISLVIFSFVGYGLAVVVGERIAHGVDAAEILGIQRMLPSGLPA